MNNNQQAKQSHRLNKPEDAVAVAAGTEGSNEGSVAAENKTRQIKKRKQRQQRKESHKTKKTMTQKL
jgi:hypothetical protein